MRLIVGLGNPGSQYTKTRHNVGFMVIDELAQVLGATVWKLDKKMAAELTEATINDEKVILAKPQTFMNLSGESIQKIMQFYKIPAENVWVIFDDVDVPFGKLKLRQEGSAGGHQGVKSTISHIGPNFVRIRIGISLNDRAVEPSEVYVLKAFSSDEQKQLTYLLERAAEEVKAALLADQVSSQAIDLL